jgi:CHAT domain-containing protein
LRGNKLLYVRV